MASVLGDFARQAPQSRTTLQDSPSKEAGRFSKFGVSDKAL